MTIQELIAHEGIKMKSEPTFRNPNMQDEMPQGSNHWKCKFYRRADTAHETLPGDNAGGEVEVFFSMGPAHTKPPECEDVLDCLASDAVSVEQADSFEDWASDLGYDEDSRKAEKTFNVCRDQSKKLLAFLGKETYETLLWDCERL